MSGNMRKEFGDYQTPIDFCMQVCTYIRDNYTNTPKAIIEPTCGIGNFLKAATTTFDCQYIYGIEVNALYTREAQERVPNATIITANIFETSTRHLCDENDVLVIGNLPWATNSNLSYNLPQKANFKGLRGIEALTGSSNFDICEYIILQLLNEYKNTDSTICMLCKNSVARNVLLEISKNKISCRKIEFLNFNANKVFGISASACVFIISLSSVNLNDELTICEIKDFDTNKTVDHLIVSNGAIRSSIVKYDFDGRCQLIWRQGVKHDCGRVMELEFVNGVFINKNGEQVQIEKTRIFPLVKSSHFKKPIINTFKKYVIVTQDTHKQDTQYIQQELPLTWEYLNSHIKDFNNRKSIIYKSASPFAMFGIGEYSFAPYKVGLSGFYKTPLFCLLQSEKPVMTDDTAYFLGFYDYDVAYSIMLLLNSQKVQDFLLSIAFLDNKRPYTVKLLSRLDLIKCLAAVSFSELIETEKKLALESRITEMQFQKLKDYIQNRV